VRRRYRVFRCLLWGLMGGRFVHSQRHNRGVYFVPLDGNAGTVFWTEVCRDKFTWPSSWCVKSSL
jgi:hypothetical protein